MNSSPPIAIHCLVRFPAGFLVFFVFAAVPRFFTLRQSDFDLGDTFAKINAQGDNGQTFCVGTSRPFVNFAFVQEEFAVAEGFMVPGATGKILGDMGVHEIGPAGLEVHEGIANVGLALAQGLHFGAMENEAGLHPFEDVIVVRSGAILSDNLVGLGFGVFAFLLALLWSLLRTLLRSVIWLSHNLSFYLMARLSERTGSTPSGNTQRPGRNPSHGRTA